MLYLYYQFSCEWKGPPIWNMFVILSSYQIAYPFHGNALQFQLMINVTVSLRNANLIMETLGIFYGNLAKGDNIITPHIPLWKTRILES